MIMLTMRKRYRLSSVDGPPRKIKTMDQFDIKANTLLKGLPKWTDQMRNKLQHSKQQAN